MTPWPGSLFRVTDTWLGSPLVAGGFHSQRQFYGPWYFVFDVGLHTLLNSRMVGDLRGHYVPVTSLQWSFRCMLRIHSEPQLGNCCSCRSTGTGLNTMWNVICLSKILSLWNDFRWAHDIFKNGGSNELSWNVIKKSCSLFANTYESEIWLQIRTPNSYFQYV